MHVLVFLCTLFHLVVFTVSLKHTRMISISTYTWTMLCLYYGCVLIKYVLAGVSIVCVSVLLIHTVVI